MYSHAIGFPAASTIVDTRGHVALDQLRRTVGHDVGGMVGDQPEAADDREHERGQHNAASKQHHTSLMTVAPAGGRSDMRNRVLSASWHLRTQPSRVMVTVGIYGASESAVQDRSARSSQKSCDPTVAQTIPDHLT